MSNKKTLNFDFLDQNTKAVEMTEESVIKDEGGHELPEIKNNKTAFFQYFKDYHSNFNSFSQKHLTVNTPRYFSIVMVVYGMGVAAERLIVSAKDYSSWGEIWAIVVIGGFVIGYFSYYVAGTIYHWRVKWSKGRDDIDTSRNIWLFSALPVTVVSLLSLVFNQLVYGSDYFSRESTSIDGVMGLLSIVAIAYSIKISYKAVRHVQKVEKSRAVWWFIIAPTIAYLLTVFVGILN